jgi:Amt family ammonium transporter
LDVVGVHLVGGLTGTLLIGLFASPSAPNGVAGLLYGGGLDQLFRQVVGASAVLVYSVAATTAIGLGLRSVMAIRVAPQAELDGIDLAEHAEVGYDLSSVRYTSYRITQRLVVPAVSTEEVSS